MDDKTLKERLWRKSSYSSADSECVEVTVDRATSILVRDSKNKNGSPLPFSPAEWRRFLLRVRAASL